MNKFLQLLKDAVVPPDFTGVVAKALRIAEGAGQATWKADECGELQSSRQFASVYELRRRIGYFEHKRVAGLDETIRALNAEDRLVRLCYLQGKDVLIVVWTDASCRVIEGIILVER